MPTGYYLLDHKPRVKQFRERHGGPSGLLVIHTTESKADEVGPDTGAEAVRNFIRGRTTPGCYHTICDSDSRAKLVPYHLATYGDGTGSNDFAIHIAAACSAAQWPKMGAGWREATLLRMAREAADAIEWLDREHGIKVPLRRISKAESTARKPGFIAHGDRDPGRRTDPGKQFPWERFLQLVGQVLHNRAKERLNAGKPAPAPTPAPVKPAPAKPAPAAPAPVKETPSMEKPGDLFFNVGTANLRNFPDMSRPQVKADAATFGKMAGLGMLQEIFEQDDYLDVKSQLPAKYKMSPIVPKSAKRHAEKRSVTNFWNSDKFTEIETTIIDLPGAGTAYKSGPRFIKRTVVNPHKTSLPYITLLNVHLIQGAWGKDKKLATPARKAIWLDQFATVVRVVASEVSAGRIVLVGGDWNRALSGIPPINLTGRWIIGSTRATYIDGVYMVLPRTVVMTKLSNAQVKDINSDHHARSVRVDLRRVTP